MKYTVVAKGRAIEFESTLTNEQAHVLLNRLTQKGGSLSTSGFAQSLATNALTRMSDKQIAWVHKLVHDESTPAPAPAVDRQVVGLGEIVVAMGVAGTQLQFPCIRLGRLRMTWSADKQRINVRSNNSDRRLVATINLQGIATLRQDVPTADAEALRGMTRSMADMAAEHGHLTGHCCFCGLQLTDARSTSVGYGPICADKFGLPWGIDGAEEAKESRRAAAHKYAVWTNMPD